VNIKELRALVEAALLEEGLDHRELFPKGPKAWFHPGEEVISFFLPQAQRRPWGFSYFGYVGIEIPALRNWLREYKPGDEAGVFRSCFVIYFTMNEDIRGEFMVEHGRPVPADLWAGLVNDRLLRVPTTLDSLIDVYRESREQLGWLAHPNQTEAWDFLITWRASADPSLQIPLR
jgi:hypothetical protein